MTTKSTAVKPAAKTVRKPRAVKPAAKEIASVAETKTESKAHHTPKGKYVFATGRRKTAIANVRLFEGSGKHVVNQKPFEGYFGYSFHQEKALKPFDVTGLGKNYYFTASISGGGSNAQAEALSHGISRALSGISDEVKSLLKKNGLLTRDDRVKERKKPGLKRARRAPQWAKR